MKTRIIVNKNTELVRQVREALSLNDGYCPCQMEHSDDSRCMCKEFRDMVEGQCHCGLYIKLLIKEPMEETDG